MWLAVGLLCACAPAGDVAVCGNDRLCPGSLVCDEAHGTCVVPQQIEACNDRPNGAACEFLDQDGFCDLEVCLAAVCGDGLLTPDEACDDNNVASGDGCRADCLKVEVCGDALIDEGEDCDDNNENPADGCDRCTRTQWSAEVLIGSEAGVSSLLLAPRDVTVDLLGNIYVADGARIHRIDTSSGALISVVGNGSVGFSGDGGLATNAQISEVHGLAVDGSGNLFFADSGNHRIRRISASSGIVTTVIGSGVAGFSGDGGHASSASLDTPAGLALDSLGNLFIADKNNHRVRRVDVSTSTIETIAGGGTGGELGDDAPAIDAELSSPVDVDVDSAGNVFIVDFGNVRIRRVDAESQYITTIAGNGEVGPAGDGNAATSAQLNEPQGIAVTASDDILIADQRNNRIRRVVTSTGKIDTVAGNGLPGFSGDGGPATAALLFEPLGVAVDISGNFIIADSRGYRVRRVDAGTGFISTAAGTLEFGSGDGGAATSAELREPRDVAVDGSGNLYIASDGRIRRVEASTGTMTTWVGTGQFGFSGDGGPATAANISAPNGLLFDGAGNLLFSDTWNHRVRRVDAATGTIQTVVGRGQGPDGDGGLATNAQLDHPRGLLLDGAGNLFVADTFNHRVRRIDAVTKIITTVAGTGDPGYSPDEDGGPAIEAQLDSPSAVALDGLGRLSIADEGNYLIRRVDLTSGTITTIAGDGLYGDSGDGGKATAARIRSPVALALDPFDNLLFADHYSARVRRIDASTGDISTVLGIGEEACSGDGGLAAVAGIGRPTGLGFDAAGNLLVTDSACSTVRRIDVSTGVVTTVAGVVDPPGMGPLPQARVADPQALALAPTFTLFAGGGSGTLQAAMSGLGQLKVLAGRYLQTGAVGDLARFRGDSFGEVAGVAYDGGRGLIYMSERPANQIHAVTFSIPDSDTTRTMEVLAGTGIADYKDGNALAAQFRGATGLFLDEPSGILYVADTGNHVIRTIGLSGGLANATVSTVAGTPETVGYFGDGGPAGQALLSAPRAVTRCDNGDLFIADTGNHRVRRVEAATRITTTVLGVGIAASSGQGAPARTFPVNAPLGVACDESGNVFVSSKNTVRLLLADDSGVVDGSGRVQTIYGGPPQETSGVITTDIYPASATQCLTGVVVASSDSIQVADSCTGLLVELWRQPAATP